MVVVVMVFDDKIIMMKTKLKYLKTRFLYKIYRKMSHVMIFSKHFQVLDRSKFVIEEFKESIVCFVL